MEEVINALSSNFLPAIIIVAILMPIWYVALYLFHRIFFDNSSELLKGAFCFFLSCMWLLTWTLCWALMPGLDYNRGTHPGAFISLFINSPMSMFYFLSGFMAVFVLIWIISWVYLIVRTKIRDFVTILIITYSVILSLFFITVILYLIFKISIF